MLNQPVLGDSHEVFNIWSCKLQPECSTKCKYFSVKWKCWKTDRVQWNEKEQRRTLESGSMTMTVFKTTEVFNDDDDDDSIQPLNSSCLGTQFWFSTTDNLDFHHCLKLFWSDFCLNGNVDTRLTRCYYVASNLYLLKMLLQYIHLSWKWIARHSPNMS